MGQKIIGWRQIGKICQYNIQKIMGSTDSIPQINTQRLNRDNWQSLPQQEKQQNFGKFGHYLRLKNNMTGEELDQYEIIFNDEDEYIQFKNVFIFRNNYEHLVKVAFLNERRTQQLCSFVFNLQAYIQNFPMRLCHIKQIPYPENLYILQRALLGFCILYQQFGYFRITQDLVCINQQGIVKVWVHSNLTKSYPQNVSNQAYYNFFRKHIQTNNQNSMVWEILTIIQQITFYQKLYNGNKFIDYLRSLGKSQLNFKQTLKLVQMYAAEKNVQIPQMLQTLIKVMRQRKGIFDSQIDINQNIDEKKASQEISLMGNHIFKQSKVQRLHEFKYNPCRSYFGSESNHTFADRLKNFDKAYGNKVNGFGNVSQIKDTTSFKNFLKIQKPKQSLTERLIINQLSFSSISTPQAYSLTILSPQTKLQANLLNHKKSSQIISAPSQNLQAQSNSSGKQLKPLTYFSQYIQQVEPNILKKQTLFSFGQNDQLIPMNNDCNTKKLKDAVVTISLQNSKNSKIEPPSSPVFSRKPVIKFTYNTNQTTKIVQQHISNNFNQHSIIDKLISKQPEQSFDQNQLPISPPSVQRSSIQSQAKKLSSDIAKEASEQNKIFKQPYKILQQYSKKKNQLQNSAPNLIIQGVQQKQQQVSQRKLYQKNQEILIDHIQSKANSLQEQLSAQSQQNANILQNTQNFEYKLQENNKIYKLPESQKQLNLELNISSIIIAQQLQKLQNQFDMDPQIASDLLHYYKSTRLEHKEKMKNME